MMCDDYDDDIDGGNNDGNNSADYEHDDGDDDNLGDPLFICSDEGTMCKRLLRRGLLLQASLRPTSLHETCPSLQSHRPHQRFRFLSQYWVRCVASPIQFRVFFFGVWRRFFGTLPCFVYRQGIHEPPKALKPEALNPKPYTNPKSHVLLRPHVI